MIFADYQATFKYIAERENLPTDVRTLFRLAADSEVQVWRFDDLPPFYVVTARYYAGGIYDQIRGAQDNGRFYLLGTLVRDFAAIGNVDRGFQLMGVADGNSYTWKTVNGRLRLITTWHMSAAEDATNTYEWDGKTFQLMNGEAR